MIKLISNQSYFYSYVSAQHKSHPQGVTFALYNVEIGLHAPIQKDFSIEKFTTHANLLLASHIHQARQLNKIPIFKATYVYNLGKNGCINLSVTGYINRWIKPLWPQ